MGLLSLARARAEDVLHVDVARPANSFGHRDLGHHFDVAGGDIETA
jgi:hypothetical protein